MAKTKPAFDAETYLASPGVAKTVKTYGRGDSVYAQGDACGHVYFIQKGGIKLSVLSETGQEAIVAMLGPGDFFGEGALTGQPIRLGTATATSPTTVLVIDKGAMLAGLGRRCAASGEARS